MENVHVLLLSDGQQNCWEKKSVVNMFDDVLLSTARIQGTQGFQVHCVGFGSEGVDGVTLRSLAEMAGGTFQDAALSHLKLRQAFASVSSSISSDRFSSSDDKPAFLRKAVMDMPFDPMCTAPSGCNRQCVLIQHKLRKKRGSSKFEDEEQVICQRADVNIEAKPFAHGGMRLVYQMTDHSRKNKGEPMVAKRLIKNPHGEKSEMLHFLRCTSMAIQMRYQFNEAMKKARLPRRSIWFVPCYLYEYAPMGGGRAYFVGEQRLDGEFVKFNGNNGYVNDSLPDSELLQAFSHFTFWRSKGFAMVVDLQGVIDNRTVLLTDPQVLSRRQGYGRGDLGFEGIQRFFDNHICGATCIALELNKKHEELIRSLRLEKERRCQICMDAPSKTVLDPCGHSAVCKKCALILFQEERPVCPICRKRISGWSEGVFSRTYVDPQKRK